MQMKNNNISNSISIHTPTKGATDTEFGIKEADYDFNPHSHEGSDSNINQ